ncbi:hypothetical protein pdam_00025116 [Pocillopora damicornis]|uniref:PIF1/LRR1 pleckstrin homology domain-containing protein n=1 Tax=Pocillopora damicornis TaxID=46731 RepID=A0A3M6U821_POCDA|nr:hypothetical protein pdam_00025116 [Pocillopora damicornis]
MLLTVENLNSNGVVTKRRTFKSVTVVSGRNEFRDIALRIVINLRWDRLFLKELTIHKQLLQEGKATIKLLTQKIQIMFSHCPPNQLATFLKSLSLKLAQSKQNGIASNRRRLLSDKVRSAKLQNTPQLISASLTYNDFTVDRKKRPLEDKNGVSPKRIKTTGRKSDSNCGNDEHSGPERRRLRSLSSFQMNLIPEQRAVINAIRAGKSVFFTGSAGTGKSYLTFDNNVTTSEYLYNS